MTLTFPPTVAASLFGDRGPVSEQLFRALRGDPADSVEELAVLEDLVRARLAVSRDLITDDDLQLALFGLYLQHSDPEPWMHAGWEWNPALLAIRALIETAFEEHLRKRVVVPSEVPSTQNGMAELLFELTAETSGPSLSRWVSKKATNEQLREFMILRSIYTLREADAHSWAIPRLRGRSKVALVEIQSDEYGAGRPERMHAAIFAGAMKAMGLDVAYPAYVQQVPAVTLASMNMMSMFGLHRRLRGAIAGHLAAFEMTSSIPNRHYGNGFKRLGYGEDVTWYFDEHVEADAVHEQIAGRDLAGALAVDEPDLAADIVFGAAACLFIDGLVGDHMLDAWTSGTSALRILA